MTEVVIITMSKKVYMPESFKPSWSTSNHQNITVTMIFYIHVDLNGKHQLCRKSSEYNICFNDIWPGQTIY